MLSIVRGGPRIMFMRGVEDGFEKALSGKFTFHEYPVLEDAYNNAGEGQSMILLGRPGRGMKRRFLVVDSLSDEILAFLLNRKNAPVPKYVLMMPRTLLFRIFGEKERVINQIAADYGAKKGKFGSLLRPSRRGSIAVCFTASPLNRPLSFENIMDDILHIQGIPYESLFNSLRSRALWYFSEGLENRQWNDLEIRIYDSWGYFMEHYERLRTVLESLEAGMVLGEGWGKDYAHILMTVKIYRLRLFTFLPPKAVKEILMGLEYSADGTRLADLDLYMGRDKISWGGIGQKAGDRGTLGFSFREKLFSRLFEEDRKKLQESEVRILNLRKENT